MNAIKAIVRNGRLETSEPIDLPEGTELTIPLPDTNYAPDAEDTSPAGIAAWLAWYETVEPLKMTAAEEADAESWLKQCADRGTQTMAQDVEGLFR